MDDFILAIQYYISELSKILDDILCLEVALYFNICLLGIVLDEVPEIGVFDKFLDDWVENTVITISILLEP